MKKLVWLGMGIGGTIGGLLGTMADHGNAFGGWSILGTALGSFAGIWAAVKISQTYL